LPFLFAVNIRNQ